MSDSPTNPNPPGILPSDTFPTGPELSTQAAPSKPAFYKLFVGPDGIRAGWRLLIYLALVYLLGLVLNKSLHASGYKLPSQQDQFSPTFVTISRLLNFLVLLIPAFIMAKIERRPVGVYGLPARGAFGRRFWEGIGWGFGAVSILLVMLRICGAFYFGSFALNRRDGLYYGATWGIAFLMVGFFEEYMFRGYVQYTLTTAIGFWPTAILLSFLFAFVHKFNPGETWVGLVDVFLAGLVLAAMLIRTGNLWLPVGFHLGWDWAESYFYGVADSGMQAKGALLHPSIPTTRAWWVTGGTVGPEGSVFSCIVEVLLIVLVLWRFRENRYPPKVETGPALVTAA